MKKFQVSDLFSHSLHFATDLIKSKSFALSGEASKPGSNGQAKLVTVQIKRVGGFKHRKALAAYFHHSEAPQRGQSSAQPQEEPAPLGKACPSQRKWAEPLVASHLLRCLSTFDVSAPRPGSARVAGRRVGQRPSAWKCRVPKGPRRLLRYRLRPKALGGWREVETDHPSWRRRVSSPSRGCPAGFRVELGAEAGVSDTRGLFQRAYLGTRHFPRTPLRATAR